jgi:DNA-binding NtrC family response regulator
MNHYQKAVTKTGDGTKPINQTKKILLIGDAKSDALLNRQETYRLFHCDSMLQAWELVYRYRPHLIILELDNSDRTALSTFQECRVLAGRVPIIVMTPAHLTRPLMKVLENRVLAVIPTSSILQSVSKVLQGLEV